MVRLILANLLAWPLLGMVASHRMFSGRSVLLELEINALKTSDERAKQVHLIEKASADDRVVGLLLKVYGPPGGWASTQDLIEALSAFRGAGKQIWAYLEAPGNAAMAIATTADKVIITPAGQVGLVGVGTEMTFFGAALRRLGVQPDFEAAGSYKSFGESFTRSFASPANMEATKSLIDGLQRQLVQTICTNRQVSEEEVVAAMAQAPLSAEVAVQSKLVDRIGYPDQVDEWVKESFGNSVNRVEFANWAARETFRERVSSWLLPKSTIAVLHLEGAISMEAQPGRGLGARDVLPALIALRDDTNVSAVVLHVSSPGGSVLASDLMWREVKLLRQTKPVVACFEDVAASGGYYLAAPVNEIVARPGTLTGSIGVFGGKLVVGEGLRKVGVHTQEVTTSPQANMFSGSKRFTDSQRKQFRAMLSRIYDDFVNKVASGRKTTPEEVEPHCQGRVWTGIDAKERGLVDHLGGLSKAIERAAKLAAVERFRLRTVLPGSPWARLMSKVRGRIPGVAQLSGVQARLQFLLESDGKALAMLPFRLKP